MVIVCAPQLFRARGGSPEAAPLALLDALREPDSATGLARRLEVPSRLRFASTETFDAFTVELTEELGRLVRKYHDETETNWFVLGAYPAISEAA